MSSRAAQTAEGSRNFSNGFRHRGRDGQQIGVARFGVAATGVGEIPRPSARLGMTATRQSLRVDQVGELLEKIAGIVRTGRGFGMILHAEDWQLAMAHSFHRAVV